MTSALKAKGMYKNTLIVLLSDNGGPASTMVSGHAGNNWPHRGGKQTNFEGALLRCLLSSSSEVDLQLDVSDTWKETCNGLMRPRFDNDNGLIFRSSLMTNLDFLSDPWKETCNGLIDRHAATR